jgi:phosphoserine aminotransferase
MLCVEDWIASLEVGRSIGPACPALIARAEAKRGGVAFCEGRDWIANLAEDR